MFSEMESIHFFDLVSSIVSLFLPLDRLLLTHVI